MIELIFITCLASTPQDCTERSMIFTDVTPMMCLMGAQPELAKWVNTHPGHEIREWRCQNTTFAERDA